jgi:hypothetical protein
MSDYVDGLQRLNLSLFFTSYDYEHAASTFLDPFLASCHCKAKIEAYQSDIAQLTEIMSLSVPRPLIERNMRIVYRAKLVEQCTKSQRHQHCAKTVGMQAYTAETARRLALGNTYEQRYARPPFGFAGCTPPFPLRCRLCNYADWNEGIVGSSIMHLPYASLETQLEHHAELRQRDIDHARSIEHDFDSRTQPLGYMGWKRPPPGTPSCACDMCQHPHVQQRYKKVHMPYRDEEEQRADIERLERMQRQREHESTLDAMMASDY